MRTPIKMGAGIDVQKEYSIAFVAIQRHTSVQKLTVQQFSRNPIGPGEMQRFLNNYALYTFVMESTGVYTPVVKELLEAAE